LGGRGTKPRQTTPSAVEENYCGGNYCGGGSWCPHTIRKTLIALWELIMGLAKWKIRRFPGQSCGTSHDKQMLSAAIREIKMVVSQSQTTSKLIAGDANHVISYPLRLKLVVHAWSP
jgi:hypothetical protein